MIKNYRAVLSNSLQILIQYYCQLKIQAPKFKFHPCFATIQVLLIASLHTNFTQKLYDFIWVF